MVAGHRLRARRTRTRHPRADRTARPEKDRPDRPIAGRTECHDLRHPSGEPARRRRCAGRRARGPMARNERITNFAADPGPGSVEDFVQRARARRLNPRRDPRLLRYSLLHNLRQLPDQTWTWKYDRRRITPEHFANSRAASAGFVTAHRRSPVPYSWCEAPRATCSATHKRPALRRRSPTGRWAKVESAGHNIQSDNPRGLVRVLTDFLAADIGHDDADAMPSILSTPAVATV